MILLIDNYDSFSYNLYQLIGTIEPDIKVIRNDELTVQEIDELNPTAIILSPGPGHPEDAGVCIDVVKTLGDHIPILGVCLGHQAICAAFGGTVTYAKTLMHGKQSKASLNDSALFHLMSPEIDVARYHSLSLKEETCPEELVISSRADDGEIMSVEHKHYPIYGLQFHPESIMTPQGLKILDNFIKIASMFRKE